jgi:hypothetical protein
MNTKSFRSSVLGSISSGLRGVSGWAINTISKVRWRIAETRKPCRWSNLCTLCPSGL